MAILSKKIIYQFLNIHGLERLFNEHYYDFEWDMHMGLNFRAYSPNYYRDHFEHQIRNVFMMLKWLDNYNFDQTVLDIHRMNHYSKVSAYFSDIIDAEIDRIVLNEDVKGLYLECAIWYYANIIYAWLQVEKNKVGVSANLKLLFDSLYSYLTKHWQKDFLFNTLLALFDLKLHINKSIITMSGKDPNPKKIFNITKMQIRGNIRSQVKNKNLPMIVYDYLRENYQHYVIRAACMLSGLFHDTAYPVCHYMKLHDRISEYVPSMYMFIQNDEDSFNRMASLLNGSLLFTVVSRDELRKSLERDIDGERTHGAYSAFDFLLFFYDSERINILSTEKRLAVELAALAIFNHTIKYSIQEKTVNDCNYYRPEFQLNPLSYMLRICDDLQEWNRAYFEISNEGDYSVCPQCGSPVVHLERYIKLTEKKITISVCRCKERNNHHQPISFYKRLLYTVTTCETVIMEKINKDIVFTINYNPYKLLHMARISSSYAKYRAKELSLSKKLLVSQKFYLKYEDENRIDNIFLSYFISSNPIFIKSEILYKYIKENKDNLYSNLQIADITSINEHWVETNIYFTIKNDLESAFFKNFGISEIKPDKAFIVKKIAFYAKISKLIELASTNSKGVGIILNEEDFIKELFSLLPPVKNHYHFVMESLLKDTYVQIKRWRSIAALKDNPLQEDYFNQFVSDDSVFINIDRYCNPNNWFWKNIISNEDHHLKHNTEDYYFEHSKEYIDYFSDLYLFEVLSSAVEHK